MFLRATENAPIAREFSWLWNALVTAAIAIRMRILGANFIFSKSFTFEVDKRDEELSKKRCCGNVTCLLKTFFAPCKRSTAAMDHQGGCHPVCYHSKCRTKILKTKGPLEHRIYTDIRQYAGTGCTSAHVLYHLTFSERWQLFEVISNKKVTRITESKEKCSDKVNHGWFQLDQANFHMGNHASLL